jgi:hypothetical protein
MAKFFLFSCFVYLILFFANDDVEAVNEDIGIYELKMGDFSVKLTNYGATVISVIIPDKNGLIFFFIFIIYIRLNIRFHDSDIENNINFF